MKYSLSILVFIEFNNIVKLKYDVPYLQGTNHLSFLLSKHYFKAK